MPSKVEIHPTARIAFRTLLIALVVAFSVLGAKRIFRTPTEEDKPNAPVLRQPFLSTNSELLLPVVELRLQDASLEAAWSVALSEVLSGMTEAPVEGGRVDVLTDHYAIEVERLEKWHEAIGQASHYANETKKMPIAALMIPSDLWPLSPTTKAKLRLIDETCTSKGIKVLLLRRVSP
jgi:hypothetical protein